MFLRFAKYSLVGSSTFVLDLALLYVLINLIGVNYLVASGLAFLLAISINYYLSRKYVFSGSERGWNAGYINFLVIAMFGLCLVISGMYLLVSQLGVNYLLSRIVIAIFSGFWNYLLNLYINFQVVGKH